MKGANKENEEDKAASVVLGSCIPAAELLPLTINDDMQRMFLRLKSSSTVAQKLVEDQMTDSPRTLASRLDKDITVICDVIRSPVGLVEGRTPNRGYQISVLAMKYLKFAVFMFKSMENCTKPYVNSRAVLE